MQARGIYFVLSLCFLAAAFSVGFLEAQKVQQKEPETTIDETSTEDNTKVSNVAQDNSNSTQVNNTLWIDSVSNKPVIVVGNNDAKDLGKQPENTEESKTADGSEQGKKNKVLDSISVKIFRAEENGIWLSDMTLNKQIPFKNISHLKAFSVDYHHEKQLVFYAANNTIFRNEVSGSKMTTRNSFPVVTHSVDGPVSLTVDWIHDKLYWLSNRHSSVECSELDGSNRTVLIDTIIDTEYPSNIALDPYEQLIFIVSNNSIYRATLAGSELTHVQLQGNETRAVKSVAVDTHNKRLYYTGKDGHYKTGQPYLASCNYKGEQLKELPLKEVWNDIFSIGVFRDILYFAHYPKSGPDTLWSIDVVEYPPNPVQVYSTEGGLWSIKIYHPEVQKRAEKYTEEKKNM